MGYRAIIFYIDLMIPGIDFMLFKKICLQGVTKRNIIRLMFIVEPDEVHSIGDGAYLGNK
jgi:hypothetical protein